MASQLENAEGAQPHEIVFAAPESEEDMWKFLLFSPSPQHTAALCVQREPAMASSSISSSSGAHSHTVASSEKEGDRMLSRSLASSSRDSSPGMCSTDSKSLNHSEEVTSARDCEIPEKQYNWSLQCWRTIPFVHDKRMEFRELLIHGYSV